MKTLFMFVAFNLSFAFLSTAEANSLILSVAPPSKKLSYSSPRALLTSLKSAYGAIPGENGKFGRSQENSSTFLVGHTMFEINCDPTPQRTGLSIKSAHSDRGNDQNHLIFEEQVGFSFVFMGTQAGYLQSPSDVDYNFEKVVNEKLHLARIKFLLSSSNCLRLQKYFKEFRELEIYKNFGLAFRPLYKEGGGCSSLGVSLLKVAGILDPETDQTWQRKLLIPQSLLGDPAEGVKVSIRKMLTSWDSRRWAREGEAHRALTFYEPQKIFDWAKSFAEMQSSKLPANVNNSDDWARDQAELFRVNGVTFDYRNLEAPQSPIWKN